MKNIIKTAAIVSAIILSTGCSMAQMKTSALDSFHNTKNAMNDPQSETIEVAVMNGKKKVGTSGDVFVTVYDGTEYSLIRRSAIGAVTCTITNEEGEITLRLKENQRTADKVTKDAYGVTDYTPHGNVNDTECTMS